MLYIVLTVALCLFSVTFHELGHAYAMKRCRVQISTISLLGIPLPFLPRFSREVFVKWQDAPINVQIHAFLIGAYVLPADGELAKLSVLDTAYVYGAGPHASFLYGFMMALCAYAIHPGNTTWLVLAAMLAAICILLVAYRFICRYIVLAIGVLLAVLIAMAFISDFHHAAAGMGGPVSIVHEGAKQYQAGHAVHRELSSAFEIASWISFTVGLSNSLPIGIFDGGRIASAYMSRLSSRAGKVFNYASAFVFAFILWSVIRQDGSLIGQLFQKH